MPLGACPESGSGRADFLDRPLDLAVLGQDPRFGGGALVQTDAFLEGAAALGRTPALLYEPHPGLGGPRLTWRRVEALRQLGAARRLADPAREARSLWVVATLAQHGAAAPRTGRPYACWIGTTIDAEWAGRAPGLAPLRRALAGASIRTLRELERRVLQGAVRLHATSPASRASVAAAAGLHEDAVSLLPIPVDLDRFAPEADEAWLARLDTPLVGFVGRADDPRKNAGLLLRAFARVRGRLPEARLRLIGVPPRAPGGAGVEATGSVAEVAPHLRECALLVLPSRQEGFGIAVAEALACGVPAVVTPSGGPEELVRRSGAGVVTDGWSEDELAATVLDLLGDRPRLAELRRRGREHVAAEHSPARFGALLAEAMRELDG
jgi:glycosyltransferase involved in cell wall biosynthesis